MKLFGVLGSPVAHSRSPAMHNAAFQRCGVAAHYLPFDVPPDQLADAVTGLWALGIGGANITVPHKQAVMGLVAALSDEARLIGAVNTLVRGERGFRGENTDARGLVRALEEAGTACHGCRALIVGGGGAARAAVVGLAHAGAEQITIATRRPAQAQALVAELAASLQGTSLRASDLATLAAPAADATLVIQATNATLPTAPDPEGFAASLPLSALPPEARVMDLVYEPRETAVLRAARARGLRTIDGLGMLLHQGALAFELWLGRPAPLDAMRAALGLGAVA